ncbi:MAG: HAMP domain-containing histidine kinase [Sandaracinaceae bacterium]|nr:MAG: HAMP domain-containing histidine kinase [Sandaracinaceae bacterium]
MGLEGETGGMESGATPAERRSRTLLAVYIGAAIVLTLGYMAWPTVFLPGGAAGVNVVNRYVVPGVSVMVGAGLLLLLMRGHTIAVARAMVGFTLVSNTVVVIAADQDGPTQTAVSVAFMVYPVLFAGVFLSARETLVTWVVAVVLAIIAVNGRGVLLPSLEVVVFLGGFALLTSWLRQRDLSDQRAQMQRTNTLQRQLLLSDRLASLGVMAAGTAHELGNALTVLRFSLESASDSTETDAVEESIEAGQSATDRLEELVSDLRSLGRTDVSASVTSDPADAVRSAVRLLRPTIPRGVTLSVETEEGVPRVKVPSSRMGQIVLNLVRNAVDAMPPERVAPTIEVRVAKRGREVILEVTDNASGMPEEVRSVATTPFFTTKREEKGSGLGLHVCTTIAEEAGGRLELDSLAGHGTTVRACFPACPSPS